MASSSQPRVLVFTAGGVIPKGCAVKPGADDSHVVIAAGTTDKVIGIAQNAATASGDSVEVAINGGGAKALAKATIAFGDVLGVNADGSIQKVASANDRVVGIAMGVAAAADIFPMEVAISQAVLTQS